MDKLSYALSLGVATQLKRMGLKGKLVVSDFADGLTSFLNDEDGKMTKEEINDTIMAYFEELRQKELKEIEENTQASISFLEENKKQEGVQCTESGLQYKVITEGDGQKPEATDIVKVNYEGRLIDGTVFDSSYQRGEPVTFPLSNVILGWKEGLQLMKVGSKYRLFIPSQLAYGNNGAGEVIKGGSALIFDVELLEIKESNGEENN